MDDIALIILGILVLGLALWWLVGRTSTPASPVERPSDTSSIAPPPVSAAPPAAPSPIVVGPAAAPIDVPPPAPLTVAKEGPPDDLLRMKGVGPKLAAQLADLGVNRFDQIAAWSEEDLARVDAQLGAFKGRPTRDKWIEQARYLAAGDHAGYEAQFGKLG